MSPAGHIVQYNRAKPGICWIQWNTATIKTLLESGKVGFVTFDDAHKSMTLVSVQTSTPGIHPHMQALNSPLLQCPKHGCLQAQLQG